MNYQNYEKGGLNSNGHQFHQNQQNKILSALNIKHKNDMATLILYNKKKLKT
jgi:hypothetical protein